MEDKFEEIYQELLKNNNEILNEARKNKNKNILKILIICFVICLIIFLIDKSRIGFLITFSISVIVMIIFITNELNKYRKIFKERVIEYIVKEYNSKLIFSAEGKIPEPVYKASRFDISFDKLYSEDKIYGKLKDNINVQMAQITTKVEHTYEDDDGNTHKEEVVTFKGIYGVIELPQSIDSNIYISSNSITKKYSSKRVEMDSAEFEQLYDCLTEDRITAMKIFTADLLEKFVNLKKQNLKNFQLKLENNNIYFRCACGDIFEPPKLKNALDRELIKKYYNIIVLPIEIIEKINENIKMI